MADKYFDRREAEELLITIAPWLEEARGEKQKIEAFKNELAQVASRIMVLGGTSPPLADLLRKKTEHDEAAERLVEIVDRIQETGVLVKDLDIGLVDFPNHKPAFTGVGRQADEGDRSASRRSPLDDPQILVEPLLLRVERRVQRDSASSAWSRSHSRSSTFSRPIERRMSSGPTPPFASSSSESCWWVVDAGCG